MFKFISGSVDCGITHMCKFLRSSHNLVDPIQATGGRKKTIAHSHAAYVLLMFGGDDYLEGILTVNYSLKRVNSKYDVVCMVTEDVSDAAIQKMKHNNIKVIKVPYLTYDTATFPTQRGRDRYGSWINKSYTKWNILNLTDYDKVLFLDADMLVVKNIDHIFKENTPAAVFPIYGNFYDEHLLKLLKSKTISPSIISKSLNEKGTVIDASFVLIRPNKQHYLGLQQMLSKMSPYGHVINLSGFDEQAITEYMSVYNDGPKLTWTNIDCSYNYTWKNRCPSSDIYVMNFIGDVKPWKGDLRKYPDTKLWYEINDEYHSSE